MLDKLTLLHLLVSGIIAVAAVLLLLLSKKLYTRYARQNSAGAVSKAGSIGRIVFDLVRAAILIMAVIAILDVNGVNVSSLLAGLGLASAVIGLALQDGLKDVIMGAHILSDEFFALGDVVRYGDMEGTVVFFNIRTTKIKSIEDGRVLTLCNRNVSEIIKMPPTAQVDIDLPLSYDDSPEMIHPLLEALCARIAGLEGVLQCRYLGTQDFDASAVLYRLRFFCALQDRFELRRRALMLVQDSLREAGVQIPYNQLDIHQTGC